MHQGIFYVIELRVYVQIAADDIPVRGITHGVLHDCYCPLGINAHEAAPSGGYTREPACRGRRDAA